ncbi:MAG: contractile injection system tape measure protein [Chitinophagaceae bacterium]
MRHLINKLTFEALCADDSSAFEVRHNFSKFCQYQLADMMEAICTKYSSEDQWIRIERLEINIGKINPANFEKSLRSALYAGLEKEFNTRICSFSGDQRTIPNGAAAFELIIYFLQNGVLPWWAEGSEIDIDKKCFEVLNNQPDSLRNFLFEHRSEKVIWERLSLQFTTEARNRIVYLFDELIAMERKMLQHEKAISLAFKELNFTYQSPDIARQLILQNAPYIFSDDIVIKDSLVNDFFEKLSSKIYKKTGDSKQEDFIKNDSVIPVREELFKNPELQDHDSSKRYFVKYAGVVIVFPFIKALFSETKLITDGEWTNAECRNQAIHLLRYISTGQQETPEYDLVLEKLFCGVAIDEPVPRKITLTGNEIAEAHAVLRSVIEHWIVLKNTSIDALRATFLQRDGVIVKKDDGWLLQVERKTEDVLLESIPWGYSTISLPWNQYLIHVEW